MRRWFRSLADIPRVGYERNPSVDRTQLPGHDAVPKKEVFTTEGKRHEALVWSIPGGTSSASPAHQFTPQDTSTAGLLRYVGEVLELPGEASDYHFAIQRVIEDLWKRRREEPHVLPELERLCWLDVRLVEAVPEAISYEQSDGSRHFVRVLAFSRLVYLYEREGFLHEALDVAERANRFEQGDSDAEQLRA